MVTSQLTPSSWYDGHTACLVGDASLGAGGNPGGNISGHKYKSSFAHLPISQRAEQPGPQQATDQRTSGILLYMHEYCLTPPLDGSNTLCYGRKQTSWLPAAKTLQKHWPWMHTGCLQGWSEALCTCSCTDNMRTAEVPAIDTLFPRK